MPLSVSNSSTRTELSPLDSRAIIEIITTIMTYRFDELSRVEIEAMLDITLKETRVYREIKEEGREEGLEQGLEQGRQEEAVNFVTRLLRKRLGELPQEVRSVVLGLSLSMLEELGEALLDFTSVADLQTWLEARIDN